jgi:hypothetical protein
MSSEAAGGAGSEGIDVAGPATGRDGGGPVTAGAGRACPAGACPFA